MALYLDVHSALPEGATLADFEAAHRADLRLQERYDVHYLRYWMDQEGRMAFCLIEAPTADAAHAVHREAHGLLADEIHPVVQG